MIPYNTATRIKMSLAVSLYCTYRDIFSLYFDKVFQMTVLEEASDQLHIPVISPQPKGTGAH